MADVLVSWIDDEVREALGRIRGNEAAKIRSTVIMLASATASSTPWLHVFRSKNACNRRIWYEKWRYKPEIAAALSLCTQKALAFADAEIAAVETLALRERRKAIAEGSVDALRGLRLTALSQDDRADYRTAASAMLLALADETLAGRIVMVQKGQALQVDVGGLDDLIERELARVADGSEAGDVGAAAGDAEPESDY